MQVSNPAASFLNVHMLSKGFIKDRKDGKLGEYFVKERLELQGWRVGVVPYGNHPIYDLTAVKDRQLFYGEVQWDKRSDETNNFAIEPQKLRDSQAGYFFIVIGTPKPREAWFCPKLEVQVLVEELLHNPQISKGWFGYPKPALNVLIPKKLFLSRIVTKRL
jgi:hypothetical protein